MNIVTTDKVLVEMTWDELQSLMYAALDTAGDYFRDVQHATTHEEAEIYHELWLKYQRIFRDLRYIEMPIKDELPF